MVGGLAVGCGDDLAARGGHGGAAGLAGIAGAAGGSTAGAGGGGNGGQSGGGAGTGGGVVSGYKVFSGTASMLFDGPSCTGETGATGDRWCAFVALGGASQLALYAVNVSRAAAGVAITCGDADPNCLLLTPALGGDSSDPTLHGTFFKGDTLVYYDQTLAPHAWRPGMTSGRLLATVSATYDAVFCTPAPVGTAVACLGLPASQPDLNLTQGELLAGKADGASEPLLAVIDTVIAANAADRGGTPRFSYGFPSIAGDYVAWTSRATAAGPEVLKLQRAGDPASKMTIASDVHDWDVSPDGTQWFWLSAITSAGAGMLQTASFPGGASPTDVLPTVLQYGLPPAGGKTIVAVTTAGALVAIADPVAAPTTQIALATQVQTLLSFSDRGHVAFAKHFFGRNLIDLFVEKVDGSESCAVNATTDVPYGSVHLTPGAGAAVWARSKSDGFDGFYTRLADCQSMSIAPDVVVLASIGDGVIVFMDRFDDATRTGSMRFRTVAAGHALQAGTPTPIADGVDTYTISGPAPGALVYTVNVGSGTDGVYVRWFGP